MLIPFAASPSLAQSAGKPLVYPGVVSIQPGTCVDGIITPATVSVPSDTSADGIFYTISQPDATGAFSIHAQVGDSYNMGDASGAGWVRANAWNAYYEAVAPIPSCDGSDADVPADGAIFSPFALPQDCGTAPYPAPTGTDVSSSIVYSNFVITQNGVPYTSGPIALTSPDEVLTLSFTWSASAPVTAGQFFTLSGPLDTASNKVFTSATQWFPVMNSAGTNQAGCASVVAGDITVQFTDYVNGRSGVGGRVDLFLEMASGSTEETRTIEFTYIDNTAFSITIPGIPTDVFGKRGWFMRDDQGIANPTTSIRWTLHVPARAGGYTNLVLTDTAPSDGSWTFSCAGPAATTTTWVAMSPSGPVTDLAVTEACSASAMTLSIPTVPTNTSIDFYFYADITPRAEGPFYNNASARADEVVVDQLPYEVRRTVGSGNLDGSLVVLPVPPAVTHAICVDDVWQPATVQLPQDQEGVLYSMTPNPFPAEGGHLVVIATLAEDYVWAAGAEANGWVLDTTNNTMVYETDVLNTPCETTPPPTPQTPTPTQTPSVTPTPDQPCIPPTPEECVPGTPTGDGTPEPCEPKPTPTVPAWCLVTPTPPTVTEFPETGTDGSNAGLNSLLLAGGLLAVVVTAAGVALQRERSR